MLSSRMYEINRKGQTLVEMAILLPLLLLLVMGIFEFGRAMYIKNTLTHAARAGARTAVVTPNIVDATNATCGNAGNNATIYQTVCNNLYSGIDINDITINVTRTDLNSSGTLDPGDMAEVTVALNNFRSKYRIVPFIPLPLTLTGETAMRYE